MNTIMTIKLQTVSEINNFVSDVTNLEGKFELMSGKNSADAKSILGILSLDLSVPLILDVDTENREQLVRLGKYRIV